jgi:tRNA(Arg) A34 adenosine deaminase TadA
VGWALPSWLGQELDGATADDRDDRMRLAIRLAERNVEERTGGPYGAVLYAPAETRIVAAGVDLLESARSTIAHAELIAVAQAQAIYQTADLGPFELELCASAEPCLMCLGAIVWSGISKLVYGALEEDWRAAGWDDLPKPVGWREELVRRGVMVDSGVLRGDALQVLGRRSQQ